MKSRPRTDPHSLRQPAVLAWLRLARVFQKIDARSERFFRAHGLNTAHFDILAKVGAKPEMTQQELATALLVTKGNISQLLTKLEQEFGMTPSGRGRAFRPRCPLRTSSTKSRFFLGSGVATRNRETDTRPEKRVQITE